MPSVTEVPGPVGNGRIPFEEFLRLLKNPESTPRPILLPSRDRFDEEFIWKAFDFGLSLPGKGIIVGMLL